MNARNRWLLATGVGFACLAMGRGAEADLMYGASATVNLYTGGGPFDGKWTDQGILTAQEARAASNEFSLGGEQALTVANASAQVDATHVDPATHHPIIDFAGQSYASNVGGIYAGEAIADMKYTDVVSLRPYTGISPDPRYAPGVQRLLYLHTVITVNITNQIGLTSPAFSAVSTVSLWMNGVRWAWIIADTTSSYPDYPNDTRWFTYGNWDSISVDGNFTVDRNGNTGNVVGYATLPVSYDSLARGYPYALETMLQTDAAGGTSAYISGLHSAHLVGITYADGSTPESHGYQIVDLTGSPSPNLAVAVPEPSSLQVAGLGLAVLALNSLARRLRRAENCRR
jgi:hypothetical protein